MPYSNDPHGLILGPIEKTIRPHNYFTKREIRELRQQSSRLGKPPKTGKRFLCLLAKAYRRRRIVSVNIGNCFKKLATTCGRK